MTCKLLVLSSQPAPPPLPLCCPPYSQKPENAQVAQRPQLQLHLHPKLWWCRFGVGVLVSLCKIVHLSLTERRNYCLVSVPSHVERQSAVQFALRMPSQVCQNPYLMSEGQATKHIYSLGKQAKLLKAGKVDDSVGKGDGRLLKVTKARLA